MKNFKLTLVVMSVLTMVVSCSKQEEENLIEPLDGQKNVRAYNENGILVFDFNNTEDVKEIKENDGSREYMVNNLKFDMYLRDIFRNPKELKFNPDKKYIARLIYRKKHSGEKYSNKDYVTFYAYIQPNKIHSLVSELKYNNEEYFLYLIHLAS